MEIKGIDFSKGSHIMAIVNLTPDSFFAGSRVKQDEALKVIDRAIKDGAEIIDIGAMSSRPGHEVISAEEEIKRLSPLKEIVKSFNVPISVDTDKPDVARYALECGADLINDIWGLMHKGMAETVAEYDANVCIMHNQTGTEYKNLFDDIDSFFERQLAVALKAGIKENKICLDAGIGFGKTKEQNFEVMNGYERFAKFGYPLLIGVSRKSMFGGNVEDRLEPTLKATELAVEKGINIIRIHDVAENVMAKERAVVRLHNN
ncbi:MAG: dihydropteroate synthase [Christensenellales bacterium]